MAKSFWDNLSRTERNIFILAVIFLVGALSFLIIRFWIANTQIVPSPGGIYREGIIGSPRYLNPILALTNDADRDIAELIFSGLVKYTNEGKVVTDLAKEYQISQDGKVYRFSLKDNVFWHDGEKFSADDVVFTIETIQDPQYQSPLGLNWQGVKVEKIDDFTVNFSLTNPYVPFLENLTVGIIPKHIWQDIPPSDFLLAKANLNPIGTGPYKFIRLKKDFIELERNQNYYENPAFTEKVILKFFTNEEELINALNQRQIDALSLSNAASLGLIKNLDGFDAHRILVPRYFALFFNQAQSKALSDRKVRQALAHALDKERLIDEVLKGEGEAVHSPIPKGVFGWGENIKVYKFDLEKAKTILNESGWQDANGDGVREKGGENLEISLVTVDQELLKETAEFLKNEWQKIGVKLEVRVLGPGEIQRDYIRPRNYEILLFGEVLGQEPDPFSFWHSSQKKEPGLNLALYENKEVDKLLEEVRQTSDPNKRVEKYKKFQQLVVEDLPAIFLYSPYYLYIVDKNVDGIEIKSIVDPSKRFSDIEKWYIKTKRMWK